MIPIKGLERTSLVDYPGKMCAVVFLAGCNFRCPYCHNRDLVLEHEKLPSITEEEVLAFLKERREWLDGVCVTGGEPTIHKELPAFLRKIKDLGYMVKLDTNGSNPAMLKDMIKKRLVDYVAMDIKGPEHKYRESCGVTVDKKKLKESKELIIDSGIEHEFRSTVLPSLHSEEDVEEMARTIIGANKFYLQQFRPKNTLDRKMLKKKPFKEEELRRLRDLCRKHVETEVRA